MINYLSKIAAINVHTYTPTTSNTTTAATWSLEHNTLKNYYPILAQVHFGTIKGSRAPYLEPNDAYLEQLMNMGIDFDSSMTFDIPVGGKTYLPFTLWCS